MTYSNSLSMPAGAQLTPDFMLTVNERDVTANIRDRLITLTLTDNRGVEVDQLDIVLDDADGQLALPARGAVIKLSLGWQGELLTDKGEFTVDEVLHGGTPDTLTVRARSANFRGSLNTRREMSWHDTTLDEVIKQIAERNELKLAIAAEFVNVAISHIDQTKETDASFLTRLASLYGAAATIKAGCLLFIRPGSGRSASGKPIPPLTLTRKEGDSHSFTIADRSAYTGVTANWLNTKVSKPEKITLQRKMKKQHQAAPAHPAAKQKSTAAANASDENQGEYLVGSKDNLLALTKIYPNRSTAIHAAKAKWEELQRGVAEFSLMLAMGRADIFPETPVRVRGFKSVIDAQPWLISKVEHRLNSSGYTTILNFEMLLSDIEYGTISGK